MLTILQARMSSTRLPGKVLRPILGRPMLSLQIERVRRAARVGTLVVATSEDASDDPLEAFCAAEGVACHRGSLSDVLGRYREAMRAFGPTDTLVRLTGDCPLTDPKVIDATIALHFEEGADFTCNDERLTFPKGLDVEVVKAEHLEAAFHEAVDPYEREHVTPFFHRHPERFRVANLECAPPMGHLRWTVDTPEDFAFATHVYEALYPANPAFTSEDIARLTVGDTRGRDGHGS